MSTDKTMCPTVTSLGNSNPRFSYGVSRSGRLRSDDYGPIQPMHEPSWFERLLRRR